MHNERNPVCCPPISFVSFHVYSTSTLRCLPPLPLVLFQLPLQVQFGNSDLYFICRLLLPEGTGADAQDIKKCNNEIADARWMPLDEFKEQTRHSMLALVADMLEKPEEKELTR